MNTRTSLIIKYFLIGLIALSIGTYFRLYPLLSYSSEDSSEKATLLVLAKLRQTAELQIYRQNPQMEQTQRNILIKRLFDELVRRERKNFTAVINKIKKSLDKNISKNSQTPYLLEADPFYYYGLTKNILASGTISPDIKGDKFFNKLMLAPLGSWVPLTLHPYIGCFIYKILSFFMPQIPLMHAVSFTPLMIIAFSLIAFLFLLFLLHLHPSTAFTASVFYLLSPVLLKRSFYGWYDNDPYNVLFPFAILCLFFCALKNIMNLKKFLIYIILTALMMTIYSYFWQGWMFLFCILSGAIVFALILYKLFLKNTALQKNVLTLFVAFLITSFLSISAAFGIKSFFTLFTEGWSILKNFLTPQLSFWPDLFIAVGELHQASLKTIIELTGGFLFFSIALIGAFKSLLDIFLTLKRKSSAEAENFFFPIVLLLSFLTILFLSLGAQRFALLCVIPLSILFAIGLEKIFCFFEKISSQQVHFKNHSLIPILSSFMILALSLIPIFSTRSTVSSLVTNIYNDTWDNTMRELKEKTPEESIINAWWPPGHFITSMAQRRVTFDGATINIPQAYWMANFFLSQNETEALGILRMLNDSGNQAAEYLQKLGIPLSKSVAILKSILSLSRENAYKKLKTFMKDDSVIKHLLSLTHKNPPPSYCLIYNEFVENNIQLSFLGNWNFKKVEEINNNPEEFKKIPKPNSQQYVDFLWQLSGGMPKYSGVLPQTSKKENLLIFSENIRINLDEMSCVISSNQYGTGIPYSLFYLNSDDKVVEKEFSQWTLPYSVVLFKDGNQYSLVLMDRAIAKSILVQLYFFNGKGLQFFKPLTDQSDLTKRTHIQTFEINWEEFYKKTSADSH